MLMSEETRDQLNELVRLSFDANSVVDNFAYNLAYYDYPNIEGIVHELFAHKFPEFADILTNMMIELDARPLRKGINTHDKDYNGGDWRFYPYALAENPAHGKFTVGYSYNAAQQLHMGAQDISWIGIQDSNLSNFLTDVNWSNGLKKTKFATPKTTY